MNLIEIDPGGTGTSSIPKCVHHFLIASPMESWRMTPGTCKKCGQARIWDSWASWIAITRSDTDFVFAGHLERDFAFREYEVSRS